MVVFKPSFAPNVSSWAALTRYVGARTDKATAASFVRLAKDSRYNWESRRFIFETYYAYNTLPRLKHLAEKVGIMHTRERYEGDDIDDFQATYHWDITNKLGEGIKESILELKDIQHERLFSNLPER